MEHDIVTDGPWRKTGQENECRRAGEFRGAGRSLRPDGPQRQERQNTQQRRIDQRADGPERAITDPSAEAALNPKNKQKPTKPSRLDDVMCAVMCAFGSYFPFTEKASKVLPELM